MEHPYAQLLNPSLIVPVVQTAIALLHSACRMTKRMAANSCTCGASAIKCWWPPRNPLAC